MNRIVNHKNTKEVREEGLDKFYTLPSYSKKCIDKLTEYYPFTGFDLIVEPSVGNGSFYHNIHSDNKIGLDISPDENKDKDVNFLKMDFFDFTPSDMGEYDNILVVGNPPFGKVSSLAIQFFNHSAEWANVIAFIIPRTFRRPSVQNKLNTMFHLVYDEEVPISPCCFTPKMMVKCCFQIWERKDTKKRAIINLPTHHNDWEFLKFGPLDINGQPTPPNCAEFAIRAYGGKIGDIKENGLDVLRPKSWHWIRSNIDKTDLIDIFKRLDYSNSTNTARQNSMGKGELVRAYTNFIKE